MIDLQTVINRLTSTTSYTIVPTKTKEPDLQDITALPIVFVGYGTIRSKNPNSPIEHSIFNTAGEDLVQSFELQTVCEIAQFNAIWKTLYATLIGYNPIPTEQYHTGFTYSHGGVMGIANNRLWNIDMWNIGFPTNIPLI